MAIVMNEPCPECQATGHDKTGNHLVTFDDGNKMCKKSHYHKSGKVLFIPKGDAPSIVDKIITGEIRYTPDQFRELEEDGKLDDSSIRSLALSGMRKGDAYEVANPEERSEMEEGWRLDMEWFETLKTKSLICRGIHGTIAKLYNVRVGHDADGRVNRHYYPQYENHNLVASKQRNLPKNFVGGLGKLFGAKDLWGMHTMKAVEATGQHYFTLTLTGGENDAMAVQTMLINSEKGTKYEGRLHHVWSVPRGEACVEDIVRVKGELSRFKEVKLSFDNDEEGRKLTKTVTRLLLGMNIKVVEGLVGVKDPNQALLERFTKAYIASWWGAKAPAVTGQLKPISAFIKKALKTPEMGLSWHLTGMNKVTFGIRDHVLSVWGAGTGVGKTRTTKDIVNQITQVHNKKVCVIYLEEQPEKTVRSFAGYSINKELTVPAVNDPEHECYEPQYDYTEEKATEAILRLERENMIYIADLEGQKEVDAVMEVMEQAIAMGFTRFVVDNLSAFKHTNADGKQGTSAQALDETMRRLGTMKDEHPIWIMLLSHLKRPDHSRTPHEEGGEISITDFRGSGSITFWANDVWGIERNTKAPTLAEKTITTYRNIKNRDVGFMAGTCVRAKLSLEEGIMESYDGVPPEQAVPSPTDYAKRKQKKDASTAPTLPEGEEEEF